MSVGARWKTSSLQSNPSFYIQKTKVPGGEAICLTLRPRTERDLESAVGIPSPAPSRPTLLPRHRNGQYRCPRSCGDPARLPTSLFHSRPLAFSFPRPSSRALTAPGSRRAGWTKGGRTPMIPLQALWSEEGCEHRSPPLGRAQVRARLAGRKAPSPGPGAGPPRRERPGGWAREGRGGAGRGEFGALGAGEQQPAGREPEARGPGRGGAGGAGRRRGLRRCGGGLGARRNRRRRGRSRARSCHPASRPRQRTPARRRARTARTHSPNNAPRRPAGRLAARRPTARPGERGPEVSQRDAFSKPSLFLSWRTWPRRGAPAERRGRREGDPPVGVPRGDRRPLAEGGASGPRAPGVVLQVGGAEPGARGSRRGVFDSFENRAFLKRGKLSFEFGEGKPTVQLGLLGLLFCLGQETEALCELLMGKTSFLRQEYCQRSREGEAAGAARTGIPGARWFGAPG